MKPAPSFLPRLYLCILLAADFSGVLFSQRSTNSNPLPFWNDRVAKQAIINYMDSLSSYIISLADRLATFDNDGRYRLRSRMYENHSNKIFLGKQYPCS